MNGILQDGRSNATSPRTGLYAAERIRLRFGCGFQGVKRGDDRDGGFRRVVTLGAGNVLYAQQSFTAGTATTPFYGVSEFNGPTTYTLTHLVDNATISVNASLGNWFFLSRR